MRRKSTAQPAPARADSGKKLKMAQGILLPANTAANSIGSLGMVNSDGEPFDIGALTEALIEQTHRVIDGNLNRVEAMLICQAQTLDAVFNRELMNAMRQDGLAQFDAHIKCALRAQSQCRATLEALAVVKNPPVVIAKQANIAHGPQQVNNAEAPAEEVSRARETQTEPNRLLEQQNGKRLDTHTTQPTSDADPAMATVGEIHRAKVTRR